MFAKLPQSPRRVLSIGSAVVDTFIRSSHFNVEQQADQAVLCQTFGAKVEIDHLQLTSGGGATNTAVAFQRLGFAAHVLAELGKDNLSQIITQDLEREQVEMNLLISERKEQTGGSVILLGQDGQRIIMVHRGAAGMMTSDDMPWSDIEDFEWVHVSSLGAQTTLMAALQQHFASENVSWSWNPGGQELKALASGQLKFETGAPDILFLNQEEWQTLDKHQSEALQHISVIVITRGKAGGTVYEPKLPPQAFTAAAVESVDDTGAGDAFAAGFVAARLHGEEVMTAARWGVLNAAAVVQQIGAKPGLLRYEQLLKHQQWYDESID